MSNVKVEYVRHSLLVSDSSDLQSVLEQISRLHQLVAVNVAESEGAQPLLLTLANVRAVLNRKPEKLFLEVLPKGIFRKLVGQGIGQAIQGTSELRALLRERYAVALAGELSKYLSQVQQVLLMIECFALQKGLSTMTGHLAELQNFITQLEIDWRERGDNVRCMDRLQYQILPCLQKLLKGFRK